MKPLENGYPAPDETWDELAEASLLHDNWQPILRLGLVHGELR